MATMQEYLEEMARRQATGWTPGVPTRYTGALPTSYPAFSNLSALWAGSQPKANLGDIAAASADPAKKKGVGRPKLTAEEIQRSSTRAGTGVVKSIAPMLSAISKVAGPIGAASYAYDALRPSQLASAAEATANPGTDFRVTQAYPSMAVEEGYPNVSTLPSFDVTPDAGGAVGGYPTMDADYGTMATEEFDYVPAAPTGGMIDADALAGMFDVGPMSMAQVGGIPSGRTFGTTTSPTYLGRPTGGSAPYAGPSRTEVAPDYSLSQDVQTDADINDVYRHAGMVYGPTSSGGAFGPFGDPVTGLENARLSDILRYTPFDTVRDTMLGYHDSYEKIAANQGDQANLGPTQVEQQLRDLVNNAVFQDLRDSGTPLATAVKSPNVVWDTSAGPVSRQAGAMPSMIGNNMGAMARLVMDDYYAPQNVSIDNLAGTGPSLFDSIDEIATQVDTFSSPLASPDIAAQATIDDFTAARIEEDMASYPQFASTQETVQLPAAQVAAPVSAPMAPRQQAMPEVSVPAPTVPTTASVAAQDRLAQPQADAAMARAAQAAATRDAARQAQQASAAQAQAAQNAARAVLARMGNDRNTPSQRELNAAMEVMSQVDTFASGGQRGFMGAEVGIEDGGGYTGGDFSSGAGWE